MSEHSTTITVSTLMPCFLSYKQHILSKHLYRLFIYETNGDYNVTVDVFQC